MEEIQCLKSLVNESSKAEDSLKLKLNSAENEIKKLTIASYNDSKIMKFFESGKYRKVSVEVEVRNSFVVFSDIKIIFLF